MGGAALLQCAPDLELRLVSGTDVRVTSRGVSTPVSHLALRVLDAFRHPSSVNDAVARLRGDGAQAEAWVELTGCVLALRAAGALVDAATSRPVVRSHHGRFDSYPVHIRLLNDEVRTSRYQQAIRAVVRPGDVVVDIGTGSGVMAATAALAGASRVYAIERTEMARLARRVFEANGLADRKIGRAHV